MNDKYCPLNSFYRCLKDSCGWWTANNECIAIDLVTQLKSIKNRMIIDDD